ncbi:hypothetical protein Tco_0178778 [Tanacetum coccineum]
MGTPTQVCVWSCPNFSALAGRPLRCVSDILLLISGDAKVCQNQSFMNVNHKVYDLVSCAMNGIVAYLDGTDTESEPFEDPTYIETHESPLAIAPPIPLSKSTPPVLVPVLGRTARMAMRVSHAMSSGLSASMAEVAAMSESALRKRFRSSCESSPSMSPPDLPLRKRYRGTFELVEDSEEDDEEIEESMDSNSVSGGAKRMEGESVPRGQFRQLFDCGVLRPIRLPHNLPHGLPEDGMIYIDIHDYPPPAPPLQHTFTQYTSSLLPISPSHSDVPSSISSPMIPLTVPSPVATPTAVETKGFLTELGAQFKIYQFRSLEYQQEWVAVTFKVIWRPVLALEAWAGQTDAQRAAL